MNKDPEAATETIFYLIRHEASWDGNDQCREVASRVARALLASSSPPSCEANKDRATLYYLVGRLVGLLHKLGKHSLDEHVYCDMWHVRIIRSAHREMENWNG